MKNAKIRKVLFTLIIAVALSLVLSIKGYAATKMLDELFVMNNSNVTHVLGVDAGIYQTALNAYMEPNKTMDTTIANIRTYYGAGETLKIRFSFSKEIQSAFGLKLGIKFGNGPERVIENAIVEGSYLTFSHNIQVDDNGGLQITFIEGTIIDASGSSIPSLGMLGKENTWMNTIIAKGSWADYVSNKEDTKAEQLVMPTNDPAYILDGSHIRPIRESDIKILRTDENGITTIVDGTEGLIRNGNGVTTIMVVPGDEIYIPDACDIAGNKKTITNIQGEKWYILSCDGNFRDVDKTYYCNAGKIINFLRINGSNTNVIIGGISKTLTSGNVVADKIQEYSYIIADGDNGVITTADGVAKNIVADTTAPTLNFKDISLNNTGIAYYSSTAEGTDNTNGLILAKDILQTNGTIWANRNATFYVRFTKSDLYSDFSAENTDTISVVYRNEGIDDTTHTVMDWAGNSTTINLNNCAVKLIWDITQPLVNITTEAVASKEDKIEYTIQLIDSDNETFKGSGVQFAGGYKSVPVSSVNVTNGKIIKSLTSGNTLNITVMPDGDGYVSVYVPAGVATDNVENGNRESEIVKVRSDRTAPVIHDVTGVPTDWVNNATLSVIASDAGVGGIQYSFNGGAYQESNQCVVDSNGVVTIKVKDSLGNESEAKTVNITNIVGPAIGFDTTTEGSCINAVKIIDGVNYVIVPEGTTVEALLKYTVSPYNVTVKTINNKEKPNTSTVTTNEVITVNNSNDECKIVVKGDVTGDGKVDLGDILRLNEYRLNSKKELTMAEFVAGNIVDTDDEINMSDILALNEYRLNH